MNNYIGLALIWIGIGSLIITAIVDRVVRVRLKPLEEKLKFVDEEIKKLRKK